MRRFSAGLMVGMIFGAGLFAQGTFVITGTAIPPALLQQNYGRMPKGIEAFDLSICNVTATKQSVVSSEIYQALAESNSELRPIGRQIMLASILRNQSHSPAAILGLILNSTAGVLSAFSTSRYSIPAGVVTGAAVVSISAQQILNNLKPVLSVDELDKFENQVLEPALVLDGGSCVERTVFTVSSVNPKNRAQSLSFHVR
ncbi:MAG: hypothetical protein JO033_07950 [Acidobacteriaceae bacterium]|nr:hypothetical protein [Acidobacteriaceae bacterium]